MYPLFFSHYILNGIFHRGSCIYHFIFCFSFIFAKIKFGKFLLVSVAQKSAGFSPICAPDKLGFLLIDNMLVYALKPYFLF